jgi:alpha-L-fucosidase
MMMRVLLSLIMTLFTASLVSSVTGAIPKPTARQLEWSEMEIAALIHFNMATTQHCSEPAAFSPDQLDTDNWVASFEAFGAREAVLVAKHACGFCTWPTNATLPNGTRYPYSVAYSTWRGGQGDVVKSFLQSVTKAGLGAGYYYSLGNSAPGGSQLEKGLNLTDSQRRVIEQQQMTELWTTYG